MDDVEKEAYLHLGILSTSYASMEECLRNLVSVMLNTGSVIISMYAIERNGLDQNIELLKNINKYRNYEVEAIKDVIVKIRKVQPLRNDLIHGNWLPPVELKGETYVEVTKGKVKYEKVDEDEFFYTGTKAEYTLTQIKTTIEELKLINESLMKLALLYFPRR